MAKLQCRKCGNTFMIKISVNEFHDYGGSLYNNLPEVVPATDIKAYQCCKCNTITLPTLDWGVPEVDRKIGALILDLNDGKEVLPDAQVLRSRRVNAGYMSRVDESQTPDPSSHGKFTKI